MFAESAKLHIFTEFREFSVPEIGWHLYKNTPDRCFSQLFGVFSRGLLIIFQERLPC